MIKGKIDNKNEFESKNIIVNVIFNIEITTFNII